MNYLEAFEADVRRNPASDKSAKTDKTPDPARITPHFGNSVSFGMGGEMAGTAGARIVSGAGTPWADLTCPERAALMVARGVPEAWAVGIADIWARTRPKVISDSRWCRVLRDATTLTAELPPGDCWTARLRAADWSLAEIFCVDASAPDARQFRAGLCWSLRGDTPTQIDATGAMITTTGRRITKPVNDSGRELLWRLWA